ncbi:hypothetical protein HF1_08180 [Mycoplasma haemofelis str. Langford 1]|uniref:Uncharacterized protein n=2 Tax=Mycoplasma haemofelis TaxID=29501 RepID=F6FIV7_MYCHI|nr:hypothetical protein [Mycoplasma haemofelis]AEG73155.1 hypothetical protein MHF_0897 [Mycoplasma haemofelis Ohio2]CBY92826.1 hypothetical protein HF1_08180 [Mycoplasma haemofelis str. Langford 1]
MSKLAFASAAGLGAAGTGGFGVYHFYFNNSNPEDKSLRARLISEKFKILTNKQEDQTHWETLKTAYEAIKKNADKSFKVTEQAVTTDDLKSFCEEHLKSEKEDLYSKVKRWCVVPVTVANHLSNLNLTPLSTETSGEPNKAEWEGLAENYNNSEDKISDLQITGKTQWTNLRDKCKNLGTKKNYEDEFDANLKSSIRWCALPK